MFKGKIETVKDTQNGREMKKGGSQTEKRDARATEGAGLLQVGSVFSRMWFAETSVPMATREKPFTGPRDVHESSNKGDAVQWRAT
jgi:hypothetical protein